MGRSLELPGIVKPSIISALPWNSLPFLRAGEDGEPLTLGRLWARGAVGSLGLQLASTGMALVTAVVLARLLGAADYGHYSLAMIYANLFGLVACLGFPQLIVRNVARLMARANWGGIASLVRTASLSTALTAAALALGSAFVISAVFDRGPTAGRLTYLLAMLLVVPIALQRLGEATLLSFDKAVESQLPERFIRPAAFLILIGVAALTQGSGLGAEGAVVAHLVAYLLSLAGVLYLVRIASPEAWWRAPSAIEPHCLKESLPLLATGLMTLMSTRLDVMMLGWLSDADAVGHYRFAAQLAALPLMIATTVQAIVSPSISRYHAEKRLPELKPLLKKLAIGAGLAALGLSAAVMVLFAVLLPVIGPSFAAAWGPLVILLVAYGGTALLASGLPLLLMTGHVGNVAWANAWAIACNAGLNLLLIPKFGASGTALATLASFGVLYALHHRNVRRLGLLCSTRAAEAPSPA